MQLAVAEESTRIGGLRQADADIEAVASSSRALLLCAPYEGFGWLGTYWSAIRQQGLGPQAIIFLDHSYKFSPHEAWIQLIRGPLALRSFDALTPKLKESAVQDFLDVFNAQLYPSAALLFKNGSSSAQQILLDRTCKFPENQRALLRHYVTESGISIRHPCYSGTDRSKTSRN